PDLGQDGCEGGGIPVAPSDARRGIPQGSAASPLIAEAMIAIALKQVPVLGEIIAYADNVLLLAKSESDVASMTKALRVVLEAHPVGRLRPRKTIFKAGQPIEFLGHTLLLTNGVVRIEPSEENMQEFLNRVSSDLECLQKGTQSHSARREMLGDLEGYIQSW